MSGTDADAQQLFETMVSHQPQTTTPIRPSLAEVFENAQKIVAKDNRFVQSILAAWERAGCVPGLEVVKRRWQA